MCHSQYAVVGTQGQEVDKTYSEMNVGDIGSKIEDSREMSSSPICPRANDP